MEGSIHDAGISFAALAMDKFFHGLKASVDVVTLLDDAGEVNGVTKLHVLEALSYAVDAYTLHFEGRTNAALAITLSDAAVRSLRSSLILGILL